MIAYGQTTFPNGFSSQKQGLVEYHVPVPCGWVGDKESEKGRETM